MADAVLPTPHTPAPAELRPEDPRPAPRVIEDVWDRTEPKYRFRAIALLIVNILIYSALCQFTHWLHRGQVFDFSLASYAEPFRFWGHQTNTLNDFILYPISVEQVPMHGVVLGLLVAAIVGVPIVIAILYRFPCCLPFIAAIVILAHMPWMGVTVLSSCILASMKPFRFKFRFGSALVGMLPVLAYLYLATRGASEPAAAFAEPVNKTLLLAPWVLAILAACGMMGLILLVAWLVNYRPGVIAPIVGLMFAAPMVLFYRFVGTDELAYRVLEFEHGPRSQRFEPVRDAQETEQRIFALLHEWTAAGGPTPVRAEFQALWQGQIEPFKNLVWRRMLVAFLADRAAAYDECKRFVAEYPASRYLPNVLFIQGRALDTRLDERKLRAAPARRELYSDFPHVQSESSWAALLTRFPDSPLTAVAALRLAQLRLRRGDIDQALELLEGVRCAAAGTATGTQTQPAGRLRLAPPPERTLDFDPEPYRFEAARLEELIRANRDDPRYGAAPLVALAGLDPHRPRYHEELLDLAAGYPDGLLYDNLLVAWAAAIDDPELRARKLRDCIERFAEGDALPEALVRLSDLETQALGARSETRRLAGLARLRAVVERFGDTCWGELARQRLRRVQQSETPPGTQVIP